MSKKFLTTLILSLTFFCLTSLAFADNTTERILSFGSQIKINQDSSIQVEETIVVYANNQQINHGIYRDFPTKYKDSFGNKYNVKFSLNGVKRNGLSENYRTIDLSNGVRVYIGDANLIVEKGIQTYSISYTATRELGFFPDHDELYWNVTGNGWVFPIENTTAEISFPDGVNVDDVITTSYTGVMGSKEGAFASTSANQKIYFASNRVLGVGEGMTIVVGWPKGFVAEPTEKQKINNWLSDNKSIAFGLIGVLFVLLYYLLAWYMFGKNPQGRTIVAQYEPPKDISPAVARFLLYKGFDTKCLVADIISLAVKGYIKITKNEKDYSLTNNHKEFDTSVFGSEKILSTLMFEWSDVVNIGGENTLAYKAKRFKKWIKSTYGSEYFVNNYTLLIIGIFLSLVAFSFSILGQMSSVLDSGSFIIALVLTYVVVLIIFLLYKSCASWVIKFVDDWKQKRKLNIAANIFNTLLLIFIICIFLSIISVPFTNFSPILWVLVLLFVVVNIASYFLLAKYTEKGLRIVEELKGFKLFLSVTEKERMDFHNPPEKTPELFEKFLPYALALGVENKWAKQFAEVFKEKDMVNSHPVWYSDSFYDSSFVTSFSSSFSSSISASATPPGSSSGFGGSGGGGGGGSSGGGGGGGGGGGW